MEFRQYFLLLRKWVWLIILGAVLGGLAGFIISSRQPEVFRTTTKIMVSRALDQESQGYYFWNEVQLAKTYAQIINTSQVLKPLSEKLGYAVHSSQININQVQDSLLLNLTVTDSDPQRAVVIANTLVEVFVKYNEDLQMDRYKSSEKTLEAQINQVEQQISGLQAEMLQFTEISQESRKKQALEQLALLEAQLNTTESELLQLDNQVRALFPTPLVTYTPAPSWHIPTSTPVPVPTPTLSPSDYATYVELQNQHEQTNELRELYKNLYASLLTSSASDQGNPELRQDQLQTTLALYQQIYSNLLSSYENVRLARMRSTPNIVQIEEAQVPNRPIQPQPVRDVLMGSVIGAFLMGALAFTKEFLDDTLKTPEDINHYLQLPVIGLIGKMDIPKRTNEEQQTDIFVVQNPLVPVTEAFRTLRTNIDFAGVNKPIKSLLITSVSPSEGKTTIAVNLAAVISQGNRKVILIDGDLRRPTVHRQLQIPNRKGLSEVFRNQTNLTEVMTLFGNPPISVITSGELPPNPAELMQSEKMEEIISEVENRSDIVIIDSPPAIVADPITLSAKVDGVLVVIEPGKTKIGPAQVLLEQLQWAGARVIGVVLNSMSRRRSGYYYSKYHYYSSFYYPRGYDRYFSGNGANEKKNKMWKIKERKRENQSD